MQMQRIIENDLFIKGLFILKRFFVFYSQPSGTELDDNAELLA